MSNCVEMFDPLRLCLNVNEWHGSGFEIASILENEYLIIPELSTHEVRLIFNICYSI